MVLNSEALLLMIRIILKLQKEGDKEFFCELPDGRRRYFSDLMSHRTEMENEPETMDNFQKMYALLRATLMGNLPSPSDVLEIYGKIMVNAFNIVDGSIKNVG